jgi:uncharacterized glyoxalase superfamily protein PhnB
MARSPTTTEGRALPAGTTRVIPMLSYEDVAGAAAWLGRAFGFRERLRYTEPDGEVSHLEMELDGGVIMLGRPGRAYQSPKHHREVCEIARDYSRVPYVIDGVHVYVDDVDEHCEQARSAGALILREPEDQPYGRLYVAEDLEGHRWMFDRPPAGAS